MIKQKLNEEFEEGQQSSDCFSFRAIAQNAYNVIVETIERLEEIKAGGRFDKVDAEIKQEGQAILNILKDALTALNEHKEFLEWSQPEK